MVLLRRNLIFKHVWEYWCKALGSKAYQENHKADKVALIRTGWVILHVITCLFIIASSGHNIGLW